MSEVANIWSTDQTDITPTSALLRSPTVIILFIGMWGVNIAILDRYGLSHKRAFGFLKGKGGRGREMNNGTKGGAYDTGDAVNGVEMMSTIKSNNNKVRWWW
jgi:hypothetical protein